MAGDGLTQDRAPGLPACRSCWEGGHLGVGVLSPQQHPTLSLPPLAASPSWGLHCFLARSLLVTPLSQTSAQQRGCSLPVPQWLSQCMCAVREPYRGAVLSR